MIMLMVKLFLAEKKKSLDLFKDILKNKKKKTIPLNVSAPFHCSLMEPASKYMENKINDVKFSKPKFQIISNVSAEPENNPSKIKKLLIDQIFSTVRWRESLIKMHNQKINNFIEIGPGKVLSGMAKRTLKDINCFSLNTIDDMKLINESEK